MLSKFEGVPQLPSWGIVLMVIISIIISVLLLWLSVYFFKRYNLSGKLDGKRKEFIFKRGWFFDSLQSMLFAIPLILVVSIVIMNVMFIVAIK